jgi:hypothetical protein
MSVVPELAEELVELFGAFCALAIALPMSNAAQAAEVK